MDLRLAHRPKVSRVETAGAGSPLPAWYSRVVAIESVEKRDANAQDFDEDLSDVEEVTSTRREIIECVCDDEDPECICKHLGDQAEEHQKFYNGSDAEHYYELKEIREARKRELLLERNIQEVGHGMAMMIPPQPQVVLDSLRSIEESIAQLNASIEAVNQTFKQLPITFEIMYTLLFHMLQRNCLSEPKLILRFLTFSSTNQDAMFGNRWLDKPDEQIHPMVNKGTGDPIPGFPETPACIETMTGMYKYEATPPELEFGSGMEHAADEYRLVLDTVLDEVLHAIRGPEGGSLQEKRERLRMYIGLNPHVFGDFKDDET